MIVRDSYWSNDSLFQLSSTIIDYRAPLNRGLKRPVDFIDYSAFYCLQILTSAYLKNKSCVKTDNAPT